MSIPAKEQASAFLTPLKGSLTVMILHDTLSKLPTSRFLLRCAGALSLRMAVLDTDAFYCANIDKFAEDAESVTDGLILLSENGFQVSSLIPLLSSERRVLIIDDLNSLYSLAFESRRLHQLAIAMKMLAQNAKLNASWVFATAYKSEGVRRDGSDQRSLTSFADLVVDVGCLDGLLRLRAGFKDKWPGGEIVV
jgi:hypothetical protein